MGLAQIRVEKVPRKFPISLRIIISEIPWAILMFFRSKILLIFIIKIIIIYSGSYATLAI